MRTRLRRLATSELNKDEIAVLRRLLWAAFADDEHGGFSEDDWQHALGGTHFVLHIDAQIVAHAAVVERELHVDGQPLRTGYVEAVAALPGRQRSGHGTAVMRAVNEHVDAGFELGALGTGSHGFYQRLGWQTWRGPSSVRTDHGLERTPDEDGYIMVRLTPGTPPVGLDAPINCDWRPGDAW